MDIKEAMRWVPHRFDGHPDVDHLAVELKDGKHVIAIHTTSSSISPALALGMEWEIADMVLFVAPDGGVPEFHDHVERAMEKIMEGAD